MYCSMNVRQWVHQQHRHCVSRFQDPIYCLDQRPICIQFCELAGCGLLHGLPLMQLRHTLFFDIQQNCCQSRLADIWHRSSQLIQPLELWGSLRHQETKNKQQCKVTQSHELRRSAWCLIKTSLRQAKHDIHVVHLRYHEAIHWAGCPSYTELRDLSWISNMYRMECQDHHKPVQGCMSSNRD